MQLQDGSMFTWHAGHWWQMNWLTGLPQIDNLGDLVHYSGAGCTGTAFAKDYYGYNRVYDYKAASGALQNWAPVASYTSVGTQYGWTSGGCGAVANYSGPLVALEHTADAPDLSGYDVPLRLTEW
jgi:hypothetical protein